MGEVKRYDPSEDAYGNSKGMTWSPYGDYVLAEDYDALRAENERLRKVTHVMIPTDTMEQEFAKYHRRGFDAGIKQGLAENAELKAELAALKAQEPIGWYTEDHLTDKSATTYDKSVADHWRAKGWPVYALYAAPQPVSDDAHTII